MVATRVTIEEKKKLKVLAAELGLSVQELMRKLINGTLPITRAGMVPDKHWVEEEF